MTTWLCNNCNNLDHATVYRRADAAYDLYNDSREATKAKSFREGDKMVVLSQDRAKRIVIHEYTFTQAWLDDHDPSHQCWVLCGEFKDGFIMNREAAQDHPVYRYFFNASGHLCQWSAIRFDPLDVL